jgi:signal transduction histidine kinase
MKMNVLIVDDNDTNRKLLRVNLQGEGIGTIEAIDGLDALSKLEGECPDAIISDILMPRMDGYRLCQEVRKHEALEHIPFIIYTSTYTSRDDEKLAIDCGADRYIQKPAPLAIIMKALHDLVEQPEKRPQLSDMPGEMAVMREYNEALVRKLEERNATLEKARAEILHANAELERRVQERTAELTEANEELEAFSHSLAHDMRSPLMAIDGFSHILLQECEGRLDESAMSHLQYISKATRRMHELTSDLLRLARASRGEIKRERVDVSMLARGILQDLREAEPERAVSASVEEGMIVSADMSLLRIALENLLRNAWKFTGKVEQAEIEVGKCAGNGAHDFFVKDNGAGFEMAKAQKLFGAFERLHMQTEFEGTGIGLTTVQRIMRRHGGQIRAEAEPERGATFYFDLGEGG